MKFTFGAIDIGVTAKFVKSIHGFTGAKPPKDPSALRNQFRVKPPKDPSALRNQFRVKLLYKGNEQTFMFYGSIADYWDGKIELEESDLKNALECIILDTCWGIKSFKEFCSEFGYDEDSRSAEITYQELLKSQDKILKLGFTDDELFTLTNALND